MLYTSGSQPFFACGLPLSPNLMFAVPPPPVYYVLVYLAYMKFFLRSKKNTAFGWGPWGAGRHGPNLRRSLPSQKPTNQSKNSFCTLKNYSKFFPHGPPNISCGPPKCDFFLVAPRLKTTAVYDTIQYTVQCTYTCV